MSKQRFNCDKILCCLTCENCVLWSWFILDMKCVKISGVNRILIGLYSARGLQEGWRGKTEE